MPEQENATSPKNLSPEYVSLEDRFARAAEASPQVEQEGAIEQSVEQGGEDEGKYSQILSQVKSNEGTDHNSLMQDASTLDQQVDRESQIKHLIDLAITKGVEHAVKVAQKAEDYYVLDQLHDRLLEDDLHEALTSRGLIES